MDASLAIGSHRLNQTMKTLAVITVAMAVVGSVFGAYGMNFEVVPLASKHLGLLARHSSARSPWSRRPSSLAGGSGGCERREIGRFGMERSALPHT